MCPEIADRLERIEAKLDQVLALLTDQGAEDEQDEQRVVVTTMDGKRHEVAANPSLSMSRDRGGGSEVWAPPGLAPRPTFLRNSPELRFTE